MFLLFAVVFAFLCSCGHLLLDYLTGAEATVSASSGGSPVIVIDPGHGGEDGGTSSPDGILEKDLNLEISNLLCDLFSSAGCNVIPTRTEDILLYDRNADYKGKKKVMDLAARLNTANDSACDLFLSIHMNSFPQKKYSGLQVYYSSNNPESQKIAKNIQDSVRTYLQPNNDRETKAAGKNIFLLDRLQRPAILVECGFLSNPAECAMLSHDEYRRKLSLVIYFAASEYICGTFNS